jgi:hypothetical protein
MEQTGVKRTVACYLSADEINALPEKFRRYIHDLETRCDKSGSSLKIRSTLDEPRVRGAIQKVRV